MTILHSQEHSVEIFYPLMVINNICLITILVFLVLMGIEGFCIIKTLATQARVVLTPEILWN